MAGHGDASPYGPSPYVFSGEEAAVVTAAAAAMETAAAATAAAEAAMSAAAAEGELPQGAEVVRGVAATGAVAEAAPGEHYL
jgi:hypothetical protein